jgi:hypothetical protein
MIGASTGYEEREATMLITKACPRCQGDLAYVNDVGDSYYSCVQCGHVVYRLPSLVPTGADVRDEGGPSGARPGREPVSRDEVHRRRIRRRIAERKVA